MISSKPSAGFVVIFRLIYLLSKTPHLIEQTAKHELIPVKYFAILCFIYCEEKIARQINLSGHDVWFTILFMFYLFLYKSH